MISRYSLPEMTGIWAEENRFRKMLEVEIAVAEAMAEAGLIPRKAALHIRRKASFKVSEINEFEKKTKHDVTAFLMSVGKSVGADARFVHLGLTSSDVLDTAYPLQILPAIDLILAKAERVRKILADMSVKYKGTVMMGRTHGVHAEPTTFGLKMLLFEREIRRSVKRVGTARENIAVGKISGAVGTHTNVAPELERKILKRLGLKAEPVSNQVVQRDRHAEVMTSLAILAASLEKISVEIRHLQRTEVHEAEEGFTAGQTGSSAMPHKKNPVNAERITGLARLIRSYAMAALENVALWHERDISHSSVERVIFPDAFLATDFMLEETAKLLSNLRVYPAHMKRTIERNRGLAFSQRLLLALIERGMARFDAYAAVQRLALKVWEDDRLQLKTLAAADAEIRKHLKPADLEKIFDIQAFLKNIDKIYKKESD